MSNAEITDDIRQFIFEHVDSVGQLDLLFFMREKPGAFFGAEALSRELRTSSNSAEACLGMLNRSGLLVQSKSNENEFTYAPASAELGELVTRLAHVYKIKQHKILELIFSSTKRARQFANAFSISKPDKPGGDNG